MKRYLAIVLTLSLFICAAAAVPSFAKDKNEPGRLLTGKVLDQQDTPLPNAVVYLSNPRTRAPIKTYIVGSDGIYRFPALSPNIDYEVYAQFKGKRSDTKTVSQFDNRQQVNIVLKIDVK
ncbi:MAG TPA: carboxypeptidase-like regulatory domain-containing protein [Terriglobales bacterium]